MSAPKGNEIAQDVIKTLSKDRNNNSCNLFWEMVLRRKQYLDVDDPILPRKRRLPRRLEDGNAETRHFPSTPKDHYRQIYLQALDTVTSCIKRRFDQPDFRKYVCLQEIFLKAIKDEPWENGIKEVCSTFWQWCSQIRASCIAASFVTNCNIYAVWFTAIQRSWFSDTVPSETWWFQKSCHFWSDLKTCKDSFSDACDKCYQWEIFFGLETSENVLKVNDNGQQNEPPIGASRSQTKSRQHELDRCRKRVCRKSGREKADIWKVY